MIKSKQKKGKFIRDYPALKLKSLLKNPFAYVENLLLLW